jgi:hypothetical protein
VNWTDIGNGLGKPSGSRISNFTVFVYYGVGDTHKVLEDYANEYYQ